LRTIAPSSRRALFAQWFDERPPVAALVVFLENLEALEAGAAPDL